MRSPSPADLLPHAGQNPGTGEPGNRKEGILPQRIHLPSLSKKAVTAGSGLATGRVRTSPGDREEAPSHARLGSPTPLTQRLWRCPLNAGEWAREVPGRPWRRKDVPTLLHLSRGTRDTDEWKRGDPASPYPPQPCSVTISPGFLQGRPLSSQNHRSPSSSHGQGRKPTVCAGNLGK
ncbi:uncharacterized protein LOC124971931 isoform X1 [Sciurus carolinensis]|uniref:uncharacterized protein LOC124971931 isoform X1 n=1 Tax=Sciurus carolinensis TaxID=30640 RepID=UPI001FB4C8D3|nr:uncharacterized protein LOC124971931 isoform X1 [Sciurus carolinensis]XP_047391908.1 uncharacterized protein LOC124971931 isoform X1 [Sciurus carolinensis]